MAHGRNATFRCGNEYWKKKGLLKQVGYWSPVSDKAGVNKKTKRFVNKRIRSEIKQLLKNNIDLI
jgi:hypothetical protein